MFERVQADRPDPPSKSMSIGSIVFIVGIALTGLGLYLVIQRIIKSEEAKAKAREAATTPPSHNAR